MRRRKWIKRGLLAVALVLTAGAALSYWAFKGTPDYYVRPELTEKERADAADQALKKIFRTRQWADDLWVNEQRSMIAGAPGTTTQPATSETTRQADRFTVSFTQRELNALGDDWRGEWEHRFEETLNDPVIILREDRIILAGTMTDLGAVASLHLFPRIDEQGQLLLTLESLRAGRLPMPEMLWAAQRDKLVAELRRRLPDWQRDAQIEPNGVVNADAVAAHLSKLLFDVLARRPREPVLFIPVKDQGRAVPVRLTAIEVSDGQLTLTVESMTADERTVLLDRIREPAPTLTASVQ